MDTWARRGPLEGAKHGGVGPCHGTCYPQQSVPDRVPKGGVSVTGAGKILALPKRGGGLTHAKIFWWICRCIPKTLLRHHSTQIMIIYPPKSEHLSPKIDHHQQLVNIYPKSNHSLPKMVIYALFTSKCCESHLRAFVVKSTRVPGLG